MGQTKEHTGVLLTGASSGIGEAIARALCMRDYEVYGIGRNFDRADRELMENAHFHPVVCDLLKTQELSDTVRQIGAEADIRVLINNAGCAFYGLHEQLNAQKIQQIVRTDLEVPMILTQMLLRRLKKNGGTILFISSVTALSQSNPHGAAYGAAKAGLLSFADSIFAEARKCGVRVCTILPDMTRTALYRNADFDVDTDPGAFLEPEDVADAVLYVLERPEGMAVTQLALRPQFHRIKRRTKNEKS